MTVPAGLVMRIVAPASPVPVTVVPSDVTVPVGAVGAVVSGAVIGTVGDALPAPSLCISVSASPLVCGVVRVTL